MSRPAAVAGLVLALTAVAAPAAASELVGPPEAPLRPPEAPLLEAEAELPPPPPEYLSHDADGIRFRYHPSARERVRILIEEAPAVQARLRGLLGLAVLDDVEVRVAVGPGDFARVVPATAPRGSDVLALGDRAVLVLSLPSAPVSASQVRADFRRGMAYLALDEASEQRTLPRWFRIGFAHHFAGDGQLARHRALWWASMERRLLPLADLDWYLTEPPAADSVPGAQAVDFVAFLLEADPAGFPALLEAVRAGDDLEDALGLAYQRGLPGLERDWRSHLARHEAFLPIGVAGTALWVLLALGVIVRRRWRRREVAQERPSSRVAPGRPRPARERRTPKIELPEPEVPKVSHDGRWHTLH